MATGIRAGLAYFALIFALGFLLGTIRTLWLLPAIGPIKAVLVELPLMIAASWLAATWLVGRFEVATGNPRIVMGALAFALLMAAEAALGILAFGETLPQWTASLFAVPGIFGLAGQLAFAAMPLCVRRADQIGAALCAVVLLTPGLLPPGMGLTCWLIFGPADS
jgi:hypothetical protein